MLTGRLCATCSWLSVGQYAKRSTSNSLAAVFVYQNDRLIGFGRAISDVVVHPDYQKHGIGRRIMEHLLPKIAKCNVILYVSPGKEDFYFKLGFRKMKTGMARYLNLERMESLGFIEPAQEIQHIRENV